MNLFGILAALITVTALLSFLNRRWLGLPTTIGVMAGGMMVSIALILLRRTGLVPIANFAGEIPRPKNDGMIPPGRGRPLSLPLPHLTPTLTLTLSKPEPGLPTYGPCIPELPEEA